MKTKSTHLVFAAILASASLLAFAESGTVIRASDLKQKPFLDATSQGRVAAGNVVNIVGRQGAWMQVKSGGQTGWLKLLNVRTSAGTASGGGLGTLAKVLTTGSSGTTVTTGVKGLTGGEVTATHPAPEQLQKLDTYAVTPATAAAAARKVPLKTKNVSYIPLAATSSGRSN